MLNWKIPRIGSEIGDSGVEFRDSGVDLRDSGLDFRNVMALGIRD